MELSDDQVVRQFYRILGRGGVSYEELLHLEMHLKSALATAANRRKEVIVGWCDYTWITVVIEVDIPENATRAEVNELLVDAFQKQHPHHSQRSGSPRLAFVKLR